MFSKIYKDFFKKVYCQNLTVLQLSKSIEKELPEICSELKIGKILVSTNLPGSFCDRPLVISNSTLFERKANTSVEPSYFEYTTYSNGKVSFTVFPEAGKEFSKEEESDLEFFTEQLFVIFSRAKTNKMLEKAQEIDSLTGTLNLAGIRRLGNLIIQRKLMSKFSVIFMNIKNFRKINDIVSSKNGDIILRQYSVMITEFLGKDGAIGRLGGDNFTVIIKSSRLGAFLKFLEDIRITTDVEGTKKTAIINVKAGICQGGNQFKNFEQLLGCASTAYKLAKQKSDVAHLVYQPEMGIPVAPKPTYM